MRSFLTGVTEGNAMPSISPLIVQLFDDPHAKYRRANRESEDNRTRSESKGRVPRRRFKRVD
jgi:hypothetical protein